MADKDEKNDDELSLDLSAVTNIFKKKKKDHNHSKDKKHDSENDKKKESEDDSENEKSDESESEISFNLSGTLDFLKKYGWVFLILIPILLSTFFRIYPADLPITDDWAEQNIKAYLKEQVAVQIDQEYPNLPDANKNELINQELAKVLNENKDDLEDQIKQQSEYFKSRFQDENDNTYLLAIDPYLWYSLARNYIRDPSTGFGDEKNAEGENLFSLRDGRNDKSTTLLKFVPAFEVGLYKFVTIFNKDATLMGVIFYVPVIIIALAIIPAFLIGRHIAGNVGGFFAGLIIALNHTLLGRTPAGFSDTDAYNIFFPLLIVFVYMLALEAKDLKKTAIYGAITGLLFGVYAITWLGWGHLLVILIVATLISIFYYFAVNRNLFIKKGLAAIKEMKNLLRNITALVSMLVSSALFVSLFRDFNTFMKAGFEAVINFIALKDVAVKTLWPNVLTTVAEFNEVKLVAIMNQMGGVILFIIALFGIFLTFFYKIAKDKQENQTFFLYSLFGSLVWYVFVIVLLRSANISIVTLMILISLPFVFQYAYAIIKRRRNFFIEYSSLLLIWFVATLYSFTKGTRFSLLLVPSFAILFGVTLGVVYSSVSKILKDAFQIDKAISKTVLLLVFLVLLIAPLMSTANDVAKQEIPSMTDAWYNSLKGIQEASDDAIITSWWDFGHWFYAISERRVTFDGADQGRRIHWVGRTLLESDEELAVGILRMLNCGQEESFKVYNKNYNHLDEYDPSEPNTVGTIDLMYKVMREPSREKAKQILLNEGFSEEEAEESLDYSHCEDLIDQYYIASDDMIGKAGVWGHFGSWNFTRASMWQTINKVNNLEEGVNILMNDFGVESRADAENLYFEIKSKKADQWVSGWPGYYTQNELGCKKTDNKLDCQVVDINLDTMSTKIQTELGLKNVKSIVYPEGDEVKVKEFTENVDPYQRSVVLIPKDEEKYNIVITSASLITENKILTSAPSIAESMFTRLFFLDGHGLKHFKKFSYKTTVTGSEIYIYKVEWEPSEPNIMDALIPTEEIRASHILVNTSEEAEEIIDLLNNGADFAELAMERSIGPTSTIGGDLGWFEQGRMVQPFDEAAFALELGEITQEPVHTQFGYHVIMKTGERGGEEGFIESLNNETFSVNSS